MKFLTACLAMATSLWAANGMEVVMVRVLLKHPQGYAVLTRFATIG